MEKLKIAFHATQIIIVWNSLIKILTDYVFVKKAIMKKIQIVFANNAQLIGNFIE